jgi:tetratricopeptide (TPR) repeat protein
VKSYDTKDVSELSGLTPAQLRALARDGLVGRRDGRQYRFGFQDLVMARTAHRLLDGGVGLGVVRRALAALSDVAGGDLQTTAIRVRSEGRDVVVEDHGRAFSLDSGQGVLDFSVGTVAENMAPRVIELKTARVDEVSADQWYDIACDLEESGMVDQARVAYDRVLRANPGHADAQVNTGRLEAVGGNPAAAEAHYRAALEIEPGHALAWYNLGVLFEDGKRIQDATDAYEKAIEADFNLADAHYNLARLLEKSDASGAFRHLSAYKRLRLD